MNAYTLNGLLLKIENVNLSLGGKQILRNVNAEILDIVRPGLTQGQIVGFLGPSGVGKTKLFEIMAGLLKPNSGSVKLGPEQKPVVTGKVGVVQQNYPLFNHRTVMGNLLIAAQTYHDGTEREARSRVLAMLEEFSLTAQKDHYPSQLSGGQRQRIAIAQQLLCSETFLLLDEPFSGLDPNMTEAVSKMLVQIANQKEDNTIVIVSHDLSATAAISDTLWVMGRDRNPDGSIVPGAYIKHNYNLIERDLAWEKNVHDKPAFAELIRELRGLFPTL